MNYRLYTLISYVFHPLFLFLYGLILIGLFINESSYQLSLSPPVLLVILLNTIVFPGLAAKFFGNTVFLEKQEERKIPYLITIFFYTVTYFLLKNSGVPYIYTNFIGSIIISLVLLYMLNSKWKISMHMVGVGGLLALCAFLFPKDIYGYASLLFPLLICFYVGLARIILKAHNFFELVIGFLIGFVSVSVFLLN